MKETKEKLVYGSTTASRFKITIGRWYLEIGKTLEEYNSLTELARGVERQLETMSTKPISKKKGWCKCNAFMEVDNICMHCFLPKPITK
jgi:hypothetical protein